MEIHIKLNTIDILEWLNSNKRNSKWTQLEDEYKFCSNGLEVLYFYPNDNRVEYWEDIRSATCKIHPIPVNKKQVLEILS